MPPENRTHHPATETPPEPGLARRGDAAATLPGASGESLADARKRILSGFRTRRELLRWNAVLDYARTAHVAVDELRAATEHWGAAAMLPTTRSAIASTVTVILRADDSSGAIGTVVRDLLGLHAELCAAAPPPVAKLVDWLIAFQFDGTQDFFNPDIVDYTDALGEIGLRRFGTQLDALDGQGRHEFAIQYNRERLAVALGDVAGIVASFGELTRAYRMHALAKALLEVGAVEEALAYAKRGTLLDGDWQALACGRYWCDLLHAHRAPGEELAARQLLCDRWPTASNAVALAQAAGPAWAELAEDAYAKLERRHPSELIEALLNLDLPERAWRDAQRHTLDDLLWARLVAVREKKDPASVVPVLRRLIAADLEVSAVRNYKTAAKRLRQLRAALGAAGRAEEFAPIVAEVREEHRRRPRLLEELRRAGL